jgi:hypothetical protein
MSQSISRNFPGIFEIFWVFSVPLNIFWDFPEFILLWKIISEKKPILSNWAEPEGPTQDRAGPAAGLRWAHLGPAARQQGNGRRRRTLGVRARESSASAPI